MAVTTSTCQGPISSRRGRRGPCLLHVRVCCFTLGVCCWAPSYPQRLSAPQDPQSWGSSPALRAFSPLSSSTSVSGCGCGSAAPLLSRLGLPQHVVRNVVMARDIVPRAFACDYSLVADILKGWGSSFKEHCCLNRWALRPLAWGACQALLSGAAALTRLPTVHARFRVRP